MKKYSSEEVNYSIIAGSFTNEEVQSILNACMLRRGAIVSQNKRMFRVGTAVTFTSHKTGQVFVGKVTKVANKYVTVNTPVGSYRVPANMLYAA